MMCSILLPVFIVKCVKLVWLNCIHNNTFFITYYDFSPVQTKFCGYTNWTEMLWDHMKWQSGVSSDFWVLYKLQSLSAC
jgi:hypothetical protein